MFVGPQILAPMRLNIRVPWPLNDSNGNDWPGTRLIPISKASLDRAFQPTALCKPHGECQVESLKKMMEHCKPHGECQVESPKKMKAPWLAHPKGCGDS